MDANETLDQIIRGTVHQLWLSLPMWWLAFKWYIIVFAIIIVGGMIWQAILFRSGTRKGLSSNFNKTVGGLFFAIFFLLQLGICYWIWGSQIIDDTWFAILGITSFPLTGAFLRIIGVWHY
jgi:hypothetical protein